jgi:hypothetical protein
VITILERMSRTLTLTVTTILLLGQERVEIYLKENHTPLKSDACVNAYICLYPEDLNGY